MKGPTNHAGNKVRLLHHLIPTFGNLREHTFVDLFAGGMNVGLNVNAAHVVFNDAHSQVAALSRLFSGSAPGQLEAELSALTESYGLSDSVAHGYAVYGTDSSKGLAAVNRTGFLQLREDFNLGKFSGYEHDVARLALVVFGYNNQIQIRAKDGFWTNSVGKRDFNMNVRTNLADTVARLDEISHEVTEQDFRELDPDAHKKPFVYVDPPYLIAQATYNRSWLQSDDDDLWTLLDQLTLQDVPWVMSNVLSHRGRINESLSRWVEGQGYEVRSLDFDYRNASHNLAAGSRASDEVLVCSPQLSHFGDRSSQHNHTAHY